MKRLDPELRERVAQQALDVALADVHFNAGYVARLADNGDAQRNPHSEGTRESMLWALGAEQAELELGSPDSWRDGGGGTLGVLRGLDLGLFAVSVDGLVDDAHVISAMSEAFRAYAEQRAWEECDARKVGDR